MDMHSRSISDKGNNEGKSKEVIPNKKGIHNKNELQQYEYNNIIEHIINDKKGYISTFGNTDSIDTKPIVFSVSAFFKCKSEITQKLQTRMDNAQNQLHPPFDDRYQKNMKEKYSCEEAIKEVINTKDVDDQKRLLGEWCTSRNKTLSEATKQVLEMLEPTEMKQQRVDQNKVMEQYKKMKKLLKDESDSGGYNRPVKDSITTIRLLMSNKKKTATNSETKIEIEKVQKYFDLALADTEYKIRTTYKHEPHSNIPHDTTREQALNKVLTFISQGDIFDLRGDMGDPFRKLKKELEPDET